MKISDKNRRIATISIILVAVNEILFCVSVAEKNHLSVGFYFLLTEMLMFTIIAFCVKRYIIAILLLYALMLMRLIFILRSDFVIYYSVGLVGSANVFIAVILSVSVAMLTINLLSVVILKHRTQNTVPHA